MTYIRNSTVVAEMLKKNHDCNKLKDDFEQIIHNVRNKEDVEIVRKHILLMFDESRRRLTIWRRINQAKKSVKPYKLSANNP